MIKIAASHACHGGTLHYVEHDSSTLSCPMRFSIFLPPQAENGRCQTLIYLSGLTCTEENFTAKGGAYKKAAELGQIIVAPDTSPRGADVANDESYDLGQGAGFYINATQAPWAAHYRMYDYIHDELRALIIENFPVDADRIGLFGHSMGGHGALTIFLKNPHVYKSVSAFAPICAPTQCPWGQKAFTAYLGEDKTMWAVHDATALMRGLPDASALPPILIDQGLADKFLAEQLKPDVFADACKQQGVKLTLRFHENYDHSYFFIQSFMDDHLLHHAHC